MTEFSLPKLLNNKKTPIFGFFILGFFGGITFAILDPSPIASINYTNIAIGLLSLVYLFIFPIVKTAVVLETMLYTFLLFFNLGNIFIIHQSDFEQKFSYQYLVVFLLTSLLIKSPSFFIKNLLINSAGILLISVLNPHIDTAMDFYLTFIFSSITLGMLAYQRYNDEKIAMENEDRYKLLAENSADLICTHGKKGEFVFVSPSVHNLLGYEPYELAGKSPAYVIHPDDIEYIKTRFFKKPSDDSFNVPFQYRVRNKNGKYFWFESVVKVLKKNVQSSTIPEIFISQSRSFQFHKEFEEEILEKNIQLEKSYKEIEMFAYITSHDMQEPLRMITNYLQLVKARLKNMENESLNEFIDFALKGAQNLQVLIKDILVYSTTNKAIRQSEALDMERLFDELESDLHMLFDERDAELKLPEVPIPLTAEKNAMKQVFQNLILNGLKYNKNPKPVVIVACEQNADSVVYSFTDNGIGIEKKFWEKIFEPFQRLHTKNEFTGTGLGLPICKKLLEKFGGKIWLDSEVGAGTTFYISIPK